MNWIKAGLAAVCIMLAGVAGAGDKHKVVYHINGGEAGQQYAALGNVLNHINAVGDGNVEVKVVMHGDGLSLLLYPEDREQTRMKSANADEKMQARIAGLKQKGVQFQVCANTLKGREIKLENLYDVRQEDVVPSGVAQLSILQTQGFTYIKP
ncbi:MAG: DsrE family protein [Pseudazoarcus pumilus]|nr:DsrE family protein [Pseudazoarcus pumilus]